MTSEQYYDKTFQKFMDLWVIPEIRRRQDAGELEKPIDLRAAQIIFFDDRKPLVRINSEVKAIYTGRPKPGVSWDAGGLVVEDDIECIEAIELTDEDDPNCAHATFLRIRDSWWGGFDSRYNKALSARHIQVAQEFLQAAEFSLRRGNWSAFADILFSVFELAAKSILLAFPDAELRKKAKHGYIKKRFNWFADLGNVEPECQEAFKALFRLRDYGRYLKGDISISEDEARRLFEIAKGFTEDASHWVGID